MEKFTNHLQQVWKDSKSQSDEKFYLWLANQLEHFVNTHISTKLRLPPPKAFFGKNLILFLTISVAWQGVITLAFEGFPNPLWKLKEELSSAPDMKKENSGSLWPKCTIAALENDKTLSLEELSKLQLICNKANHELLSQWKVEEMDRLSIVIYSKRSLEEPHIARCDIPLPTHSSENLELNKESSTLVEKVIHEWDDLQAYHAKVAQKGNRKDHYHQDIQTPECTLIYFFQSLENKQIIQKFQSAVEETLPGYYFWMPLNCIHMTIRAIQKIA